MAVVRILFASALAGSLLAAEPASAARQYMHHARAARSGGGWEGTWRGAWGGNDPTAITIHGNRVVSYLYSGQTYPVSSSRVSPNRIVYGPEGVVVTVTRTGANSAHATIHTSQGDGVTELTRQ